MKKVKFYFSLLKERDWLEEMAKQGWLLSDLTLGVIYTFRACEPCDKVYAIDRFALPFSGNAKKQELSARQTALDIAAQSGWELVTHDEMLNYYFVKDRAGDETDELIDDEQMRRMRAENYRKHLSIEQPKMLLGITALMAAVYFALCLFLHNEAIFPWLMGIFTAVVLYECIACLFSIASGEQLYRDMSFSRAQWEERKRCGEKVHFSRTDKLLAYLAQKDEEGLRFLGCDDELYLFEPCDTHYIYYADTKSALKRRTGKAPSREKRDWEQLSPTWHEQSMREASALGLETVCCIMGSTLVYRRDRALSPVTWDTGAGARGRSRFQTILLILAVCFVVGFVCGFLASYK